MSKFNILYNKIINESEHNPFDSYPEPKEANQEEMLIQKFIKMLIQKLVNDKGFRPGEREQGLKKFWIDIDRQNEVSIQAHLISSAIIMCGGRKNEFKNLVVIPSEVLSKDDPELKQALYRVLSNVKSQIGNRI